MDEESTLGPYWYLHVQENELCFNPLHSNVTQGLNAQRWGYLPLSPSPRRVAEVVIGMRDSVRHPMLSFKGNVVALNYTYYMLPETTQKDGFYPFLKY